MHGGSLKLIVTHTSSEDNNADYNNNALNATAAKISSEVTLTVNS